MTKTMKRAGRWRFLHEHFGKRTYWVRNIGHVSTYLSDRPPIAAKPWHLINWGTYHETPEAAIEYAIHSYFNPPETRDDRTYERQEALMCGPGRFEQP